MSLRIYSSATGEMTWTGFQAGSGLDRRKVLGLGTIDEMDSLIPFVVRDLLAELALTAEPGEVASSPAHRGPRASLGKVAVVTFSASTKLRPTLNGETVTEAVRAQLFKSGVDVVSPNLAFDILRQQQSGRWDGVTARTWTALRSDAGAETILTGEVESYELGGSEYAPRPRVVLAMRLLDAATGRILWMGSLERTGWDSQSLLGFGRIYSRGALTEHIVGILTKRLEKEYSGNNPG